MTNADMEHCRAAIKTGSYSFYAASRVLPQSVRDPAYALYAFCRVADDAVDLTQRKAKAVLSLRDRLDRVYAGQPLDQPTDRAFARIVEEFDMPKALPEALLEGLAWDAQDRRYDTLDDLLGYCARVASVVGVMMCVLMRVRDAEALARACDLGLAMQLTNIARDIGEDRAEGRVYIPQTWLEEAGLSEADFLAQEKPSRATRVFAKRLLTEAEKFYVRSEAGIPKLPLGARTGIFAARHIYAAIGQDIRRNGFDSMTRRARTSGRQKGLLLAYSVWRTGVVSVMPQSALIHAAPHPQVRFLVNAARITPEENSGWLGRADALLDVLRHLETEVARADNRR